MVILSFALVEMVEFGEVVGEEGAGIAGGFGTGVSPPDRSIAFEGAGKGFEVRLIVIFGGRPRLRRGATGAGADGCCSSSTGVAAVGRAGDGQFEEIEALQRGKRLLDRESELVATGVWVSSSSPPRPQISSSLSRSMIEKAL